MNYTPITSYHGTDHRWLVAPEPPVTESAASANDQRFVERLQDVEMLVFN